ncbi:TetR/AcrR family transcriptional regulator [Streptacidiphilus monticola]
MSLSAMYHYYSGKQELLLALLNEGMDKYFTAVAAALEAVDTADPADRLAAVVAATTRFRGEHAVRSNLLLLEDRSLGPDGLESYRRRQVEATNLFRDAIEAGISSGVFRTPYPEEARRGIIAMCNAVAQWYRPGGPLSLDELIDRHVALALTLVEYRPQWSRRAP